MINSSIRSYAYDLVCENKICYKHLDDEEKSMFTSLLIKNCKPIHAYEYISESDKKDELPYLVAEYLFSKSCTVGSSSPDFNNPIEIVDNKLQSLIKFITDNACEYASREIDEILKSMYEQRLYDEKFYVDNEC